MATPDSSKAQDTSGPWSSCKSGLLLFAAGTGARTDDDSGREPRTQRAALQRRTNGQAQNMSGLDVSGDKPVLATALSVSTAAYGLVRGNLSNAVHSGPHGREGISLFHAVDTGHTFNNCEPRAPGKTGARAGRWSRETTDRMTSLPLW